MSKLDWEKNTARRAGYAGARRARDEEAEQVRAQAAELAQFSAQWLPRMTAAIEAKAKGETAERLERPDEMNERTWKTLWARAYQALSPEQRKIANGIHETRKAAHRAMARASLRSGPNGRPLTNMRSSTPLPQKLEEMAEFLARNKAEKGPYVNKPEDMTQSDWKRCWARAFYLAEAGTKTVGEMAYKARAAQRARSAEGQG